MSERKPNWVERLFGGGSPKPESKPEPPERAPTEAPSPSDATPDAAVPPAPTEKQPPAPAGAPQPSQEAAAAPTEIGAGPDETPEEPSPVEERLDAEFAGPPESTARAAAEPEALAPRQSWLQRLTSGLKRSSDQLTGGLAGLFTKKKLNQALLDELEDILIQSDFGVDTATTITETLRRERYDRDVTADDVRAVLADEVTKVLEPVARPLEITDGPKPFVILMVGVNGTGKTTTIGKLAAKLRAEGKSVLLAAGDTFRAAAIEQLQVWGERTGAEVIARPPGSDASGLAFDAVNEARARDADVLIIDTAGRLQNRDELMSELEKIIRVIKKVDESAPHATLLTLDATTGQNALSQVDIFGKRAGVTGLVMTKLDGTARGGILVAIARRFGLPVHFIGVGEGIDDLQPFEAADFAAAIAGRKSQ